MEEWSRVKMSMIPDQIYSGEHITGDASRVPCGHTTRRVDSPTWTLITRRFCFKTHATTPGDDSLPHTPSLQIGGLRILPIRYPNCSFKVGASQRCCLQTTKTSFTYFNACDSLTPLEHIASTLPQGGLPTLREARFSVAPSSDVNPQGVLPVPGEASSSILSSGDVDPPITLSVTSHKRMEFLNSENVRQQVCLLNRAEVEEAQSLLKGMVLDKGFITAPNALRPSRGNVALGAKKAAAGKDPSDSSGSTVPTTVPLEIPSRSATASDLHVTHTQGRRGEEKTTVRAPRGSP
nr:hypothetical protein Iba_scaffold970CG0030 [Ipomoea batatas]GME18017.1 hypothetical protein Iba_scaffold19807CG0030 [Ipomoea batatas]